MSLIIRLFPFFLALAGPAGLQAAGGRQLPDPLTLHQALALADAAHPDLRDGRLAVDRARAERDAIRADSGFGVSLEGRLRWVDPAPGSIYRQRDDHQLGLLVSTRLFDFGRTRHALAASVSDLRGARYLLRDIQAWRRIAIMEAYFNVILADLAYIRDNEAMATDYVTFDKLRDRNKLGQVSDIELARAESEYMASRTRRYASDVRRRAMRQRLANLLNYPGQLTSNLARPRLRLRRKLPSIEELKKLALANNPRLKGLRLQVAAARERMLAARAGRRPIIRGELEAAAYSRATSYRDQVRAGITIEIPIFTNGRVKARVAQQRVALDKALAAYRRMELRLHQDITETWNQIYVLKARIQQMRTLIDYRDLDLDRARALYQMDAKTTLGDSMVKFSDARYQLARARYQLALMWARLDALTGRPVYPGKIAKGGQ